MCKIIGSPISSSGSTPRQALAKGENCSSLALNFAEDADGTSEKMKLDSPVVSLAFFTASQLKANKTEIT